MVFCSPVYSRRPQLCGDKSGSTSSTWRRRKQETGKSCADADLYADADMRKDADMYEDQESAQISALQEEKMAVGEFEGATKVTKGEGPTTQVK